MTSRDKLALYVATFCAEKQQKIATSPYAFFRGTAELFYERLFATAEARIDDERPHVVSNGDAHPQNFGVVPLSDEPRSTRVHLAVNDFDESCHAPFSIDLKRCATGFALLAAQCDLKRRDGETVIATFVEAYVDEVKKLADDRKRVDKVANRDHARGIALALLEDDAKRAAKHFFAHALDDEHAHFVPSVHLVPAPQALAAFRVAIGAVDKTLIVKDVAHRYGSGTASAGLARWYVLAHVDDDARAPVVLEVKLGQPSTLRSFVETPPLAREPGDAAARAQRQLALAWARSIDLDDDVATAHRHHARHGGQARGAHEAHEAHGAHEADSFLVRERCPEKTTVPDEGLSARDVTSWAEACGALLAKSHARSTEGAIEKVRESLAKDKEKRGKTAFLDEIGTFAQTAAERMQHDHELVAREIVRDDGRGGVRNDGRGGVRDGRGGVRGDGQGR